VHEDILLKLGSIPELRVVSKTTMMRYRETEKTVAQIAHELGVVYLLEGGVRREGKSVRVNGTLIDSRTDRPVRGFTLTKEVSDVFSIQSEVAQTIAQDLQAALSPATRNLLANRPTESLGAYEVFLKGRALRNTGLSREKTAEAQQIFRRAVELDPKFAAAWAELAVVEAERIFHAHDTTPEQKARADAAMAEALRLAPDSPDVKRAEATFTYNRHRDYARATAQFETLRGMFPNDASIYHSLGAIQRRDHRWPESLANLKRAVSLEPANLTYANTLEQSLSGLRRWEELHAERRRTAALREGGVVQAERAILRFAGRAAESRAELDAFLSRLSPGERDSTEILFFLRARARERGDLAEFRRLDRQVLATPDSEWPDDPLDLAFGYAQLGDLPAAQARLVDAPEKARKRVVQDTESYLARQRLALIEALLGNRAEALRHGRKSVELMSEAYDAYFGPQASKIFAVVQAWCGEERSGARRTAATGADALGLYGGGRADAWGLVDTAPQRPALPRDHRAGEKELAAHR